MIQSKGISFYFSIKFFLNVFFNLETQSDKAVSPSFSGPMIFAKTKGDVSILILYDSQIYIKELIYQFDSIRKVILS